jgi:hypothetical protein
MSDNNHFYILLKINQYVIRAMLDTGAGMSVISIGLAEKLGLASMIDTRYQGEMYGVGVSKVLGLVKDLEVEVFDGVKLLESTSLPFSVNLTVSDTNTGELIILGLDFLQEVDAIIKVRDRKMSIFDKDFSFMLDNSEFDAPRLYTDLVKLQFAMSAKRVANPLLTKIIYNIQNNPREEKYRKINKSALNEELIKTLNILGFKDEGSRIFLPDANQELMSYALQICCN